MPTTVRMMNWGASGAEKRCIVVGQLVRETKHFYVFRHPWFTAGEEKRVGQNGVYHVEPCRCCADYKASA